LRGAHGFADVAGAADAEVMGLAATRPGGRGFAVGVAEAVVAGGVVAGVVGTAVATGALAVAVTSGGLVAVTAGALAVALATGGALSAGFSVVM